MNSGIRKSSISDDILSDFLNNVIRVSYSKSLIYQEIWNEHNFQMLCSDYIVDIFPRILFNLMASTDWGLKNGRHFVDTIFKITVSKECFSCWFQLHRSLFQGVQLTISKNWLSPCTMTSSNGNIFRVTGPLCGEFLSQRPVTRNIALFFDLRLNKWINYRDAGELRQNHAHYDVIVMG